MGKGVSKFNKILIVGLISATVSRLPACVMTRYLLGNTPNAYPPKVLFDASQAGIAAIDHPAFCGSGDQHSL
jgi:hypothetical protein